MYEPKEVTLPLAPTLALVSEVETEVEVVLEAEVEVEDLAILTLAVAEALAPRCVTLSSTAEIPLAEVAVLVLCSDLFSELLKPGI